jgi:hypothetical protein
MLDIARNTSPPFLEFDCDARHVYVSGELLRRNLVAIVAVCSVGLGAADPPLRRPHARLSSR